MSTESEKLFEAFCISIGLSARRVPEAVEEGQSRPDYVLEGHDGDTIVVAVKQFDPNAVERQRTER